MSTYNISSFLNPQVVVLPVEIIDRFLARANPVFVKVYLYLLRLTEFGIEATCDNLAEQLGLLESDVVHAFSYWESVGLLQIEKNESAVRIVLTQPDEKRAETRPVYKSSEITSAVSDNPKLKDLFDFAQSQLGKPLTPRDCEILYGICDWLGLSTEVIMIIFNLAAARRKRSMNYIERIAIEWHRSGIDTVEKAELHLKELNEQEQLFYQFKKMAQIGSRRLTSLEQEYVLRWVQEYKMDLEMMRAAYEQTVLNTGKLAFPYMEKILKSWFESNIHHPSEIDHTNKKKTVSRPKANRFINYQDENPDFSDVEAAALKRRRQMLEQNRGGDPA